MRAHSLSLQLDMLLGALCQQTLANPNQALAQPEAYIEPLHMLAHLQHPARSPLARSSPGTPPAASAATPGTRLQQRQAQARDLEVDGRERDGQQPARQPNQRGRRHGRHVVGQLRLHLRARS